jgi:hypothetical protein
MTDRERLLSIVVDLPEDEVPAALRLLEHLREGDPVLAALQNAPPDDEPVTEEDLAALEEAWEDVGHGRITPHEEVRRRVSGGD